MELQVWRKKFAKTNKTSDAMKFYVVLWLDLDLY